jgi:Ala-tRNA(Pro) deacylase
MGKLSVSRRAAGRYTPQARRPAPVVNLWSCLLSIGGRMPRFTSRNQMEKPMRVGDFLFEQPVDCQTLYHPPAFTAQRRAQYLHLSGRQVAKAVLLAGPQGYFVAVLPATDQVDINRLAEALGGPVRLASEREIADVFLDCEWGVVPPFGARYGLPLVLEESLVAEDWIAFETNARAVAVRMRCRDFEQLEQPYRLRFVQNLTRK